MSRFNLLLFARILGISLKLVARIVAHLSTICDFVDDGVVNGSFVVPEWMDVLKTCCEKAELLGSSLADVNRLILQDNGTSES